MSEQEKIPSENRREITVLESIDNHLRNIEEDLHKMLILKFCPWEVNYYEGAEGAYYPATLEEHVAACKVKHKIRKECFSECVNCTSDDGIVTDY